MGFRLGGSSPLQKPSTPTVKLTPDGNEKLLKMMPQGFEFQVMSAVKKLEPSCSVGEVATELHWDESKVQHIMEELYNKGWLQRAN